jgi:hypothetical protein
MLDGVELALVVGVEQVEALRSRLARDEDQDMTAMPCPRCG